jgi:hypothetical protein
MSDYLHHDQLFMAIRLITQDFCGRAVMTVGFTSTFAPKQSVHIITNIMSFVQEVYSVHIYVIMFVNDLVVGISISSVKCPVL